MLKQFFFSYDFCNFFIFSAFFRQATLQLKEIKSFFRFFLYCVASHNIAQGDGIIPGPDG
jgi:hypothetical protein